jgi:tellurite resistance protein TerC
MPIGIQSVGTPLLWGGFVLFVLAMLALDLGVFHRKAHPVGFREALVWSGVWVSLALLFNGMLYWKFGLDYGVKFFSGYLIEKSLSIDNIFVFLAIFSSLAIPAVYQHRILFWGILTALVLRGLMILTGATMLERFEWLIYVFGVFLVLTGIKFFLQRNRTLHPEENSAMRLVRRLIPSTTRFEGGRFFMVANGRLVATPLLMALVLIEVADVVFALDSIPAVFAITKDPFIVFTSNIFAILGLRSLFFLLAGAVQKFSYLKLGLSAVLVFVGVKMTVANVVKISPFISLAVIAAILGGAAVTSIFHPKPERKSQLPSAVPDPAVQSWQTTDAEPKATAPAPRGFGLVLALAAGWMLVLLGIVFLVAPGPGIPLLVAGLALLARRYHWARRILRRLNEGTKYWLNRWKTKTLSRSETKRTPELPDGPAQMPP